VLAAIPLVGSEAKSAAHIDLVYQNMRQDALTELGSGKKRTPGGCVEIPRLQERAGSPNEYRGLVGQHIKVTFARGSSSKGTKQCFNAKVLDYSEANGKLLLKYDVAVDDASFMGRAHRPEQEWVDLGDKCEWERVQARARSASNPRERQKKPPTPASKMASFTSKTAPLSGVAKPKTGKKPMVTTPSPDQTLMGAAIEVWWPRERTWHRGIVRGCFPTGAYHIEYDDGDEADVWLSNEKWRHVTGKGDVGARLSGAVTEPNFDAFAEQVTGGIGVLSASGQSSKAQQLPSDRSETKSQRQHSAGGSRTKKRVSIDLPVPPAMLETKDTRTGRPSRPPSGSAHSNSTTPYQTYKLDGDTLVSAKGERMKAHFDEDKSSRSGFKGVCEDNTCKAQWKVFIQKPGASKQSLVGTFDNKLEAAAAYSKEFEKIYKNKPRQATPPKRVEPRTLSFTPGSELCEGPRSRTAVMRTGATDGASMPRKREEINVWFTDPQEGWFAGVVAEIDAVGQRFLVKYEDMSQEWIPLVSGGENELRWKSLEPVVQKRAKKQGRVASDDPVAASKDEHENQSVLPKMPRRGSVPTFVDTASAASSVHPQFSPTYPSKLVKHRISLKFDEGSEGAEAGWYEGLVMSHNPMDNKLHVRFTDGQVEWISLREWEWKDLGSSCTTLMNNAKSKSGTQLVDPTDEEPEAEENESEEEPSSDGECDVDTATLDQKVLSLYFVEGRKGWYNGTVIQVDMEESDRIKIKWDEENEPQWIQLKEWQWKYGPHRRQGARIEKKASASHDLMVAALKELDAKKQAQAARRIGSAHRYFLDRFRERWTVENPQQLWIPDGTKAASIAWKALSAENREVYEAKHAANMEPQSFVEQRVTVHFDDGEVGWYEGTVKKYDEKKKRHLIHYDDGEKTWTSLISPNKQWKPVKDGEAEKEEEEEDDEAEEMQIEEEVEEEEEVVEDLKKMEALFNEEPAGLKGRQIELFYSGLGGGWFKGDVTDVNEEGVLSVCFSDGDSTTVVLDEWKWRLVKMKRVIKRVLNRTISNVSGKHATKRAAERSVKKSAKRAEKKRKKADVDTSPGVADEEVLKDPSRLQGRRISLFFPRGSASGWHNAVVSDCKVDGRVLVTWEETLKSEELLLGDFEWLLLKEVTGVRDSLQAAPAPQEGVGDPNQLVHELVMVHWAHGDAGWYSAVVSEYCADSGLHRVEYLDGDNEYLNLTKPDKPWKRTVHPSVQQKMDGFALALNNGDQHAKSYAARHIAQLGLPKDSRSTKDFSALHLAVSKGMVETVQYLLEAGLDPESPCGKLGLSAREEARSQKGKGKQRMEIYRLIELRIASAALQRMGSVTGVTGTPILGVSSVSPIQEDEVSSALDVSLDISMDTSLHEPTPTAKAEHQLLRGSGGLGRDVSLLEERHRMKPPAMPGRAAHGRTQINKENSENHSEETIFGTPSSGVIHKERGLKRRLG